MTTMDAVFDAACHTDSREEAWEEFCKEHHCGECDDCEMRPGGAVCLQTGEPCDPADTLAEAGCMDWEVPGW